jgi:hypothetical protein
MHDILNHRAGPFCNVCCSPNAMETLPYSSAYAPELLSCYSMICYWNWFEQLVLRIDNVWFDEVWKGFYIHLQFFFILSFVSFVVQISARSILSFNIKEEFAL